MKKIRTDDLTGHALGYAVALAMGRPRDNIHFNVKPAGGVRRDGIWLGVEGGMWTKWTPWKIWNHGGPLASMERIGAHPIPEGKNTAEEQWHAFHHPSGEDAVGPTELVARMRCFVKMKLGDTVEIPEDVQ